LEEKMPNARWSKNERGFYEFKKKVAFTDLVQFQKGAGLLPDRTVEFFTDGKFGDDDNDGLSMDQPKATIGAAITAMNARVGWADDPWARGDILYIAPGAYAENLLSLPYGGKIIGLGDCWDNSAGYGGVTIMPATGAAVDVTSALDMQIHNVAFRQVATAGALFQADNFNHVWLNHCFFQGIPGASPSTTRGFEVVKDCTRSKLTDCYFMQCKTGIYINTDNAAEKQIISTLFEDITIHQADVAGFHFDENCAPTGVLVNRCNVGGNDCTLALGMDDDSSAVSVSNSNFWASAMDPADGNNYYNHCYVNGVLYDST